MLLKPPCFGLGKYTWTLKVLYCSGSSELSEKDIFPPRRFTELEAIKLTNPSEIFHETVVAKKGSIVILKNASFKRLHSVFRPLELAALHLYGFDRSQRCRQRSRWCTFQQNILICLLTSQFSWKPLNTAENLAGAPQEEVATKLKLNQTCGLNPHLPCDHNLNF